MVIAANDEADKEFPKQPVRVVNVALQIGGARPPRSVAHLVYGGMESEQGKQEIRRRLAVKIYELSTEYSLTQDQQAKLKTAGEVEARQFIFEADQLVRAYEQARDEAARQQIREKAAPLVEQRRSLFGPQSFLLKVTDRTVTPEQRQIHDTLVKERLRLRHRSNIEGAIRDVERLVVLQISQHEALVELLIREIPPPESTHEFDESLVKFQFAQIPSPLLKEIFKADEWLAVSERLNEFRSMKPLLVQYGLIADSTSSMGIESDSAPAKEPK